MNAVDTNVLVYADDPRDQREAVLDSAEETLNRYSLSFWDSLLVASCHHYGVERLYTEDFDAYPKSAAWR